jgi:hypothetical protein
LLAIADGNDSGDVFLERGRHTLSRPNNSRGPQ